LNFNDTFLNEAACKAKWKEYRDQQGVICPHCGSQAHYWKADKECYECKQCKYRRSLKSNTVMNGSQLPFRYWFIAIHLLTSTKKSFSAMELKRQLGHSTCNPVWALLHKLRAVMGTRDAEYDLR
jgi:transposase-like protein